LRLWGSEFRFRFRTGLRLGFGLRLRLKVCAKANPELADQCERALISIPLNVAEGTHSRGRNQQARFHTAAGSAREVLACLETAEALGWMGAPDAELLALFNRVIGTLVRLAVPRGKQSAD
jgi:four helix bundle protein